MLGYVSVRCAFSQRRKIVYRCRAFRVCVVFYQKRMNILRMCIILCSAPNSGQGKNFDKTAPQSESSFLSVSLLFSSNQKRVHSEWALYYISNPNQSYTQAKRPERWSSQIFELNPTDFGAVRGGISNITNISFFPLWFFDSIFIGEIKRILIKFNRKVHFLHFSRYPFVFVFFANCNMNFQLKMKNFIQNEQS